ncbi:MULTISPECIES: right-handed parallel beta-helix repeat-containing protein [Chryseobacterium]|uniref:Right handed beta helix domain-containing protein n=1 Tax=Chryseobacterium taihuense TaxID=1141221 RepID=A0A4U8WCG7_9FLAO|nr:MULTISPECIES: right-handed parallel beta-helix repeat-containing protein [Chryseobacterium]QQV03729.1 right-handed parallel beta-helix repeat-containing protein [Chryseobacterium sp. FDAARGOS 1104]VFB02930.1 Uncharacterised protein [Chryseobacterium taihuense]
MSKKIVFILIFITYSIFAQEKIYISTLGNDKNSGSLQSPLKSLEAALLLSKKTKNKPTEIHVSEGNYYLEKPLEIDATFSRSKINRLKIIGCESKKTVFFGGKKIIPTKNSRSGYIILNSEDNVKYLSGNPVLLSVNGRSRNISRYPSVDFLTTQEVQYENGKFKIKIPQELNIILKVYNEEQIRNIFFTFFIKWTNVIRYVYEHDFQNATVSFIGNNFPDYYKIEPNKTIFYANNIEKELKEGEWFYKDLKKIIYKPFPSEVSDKTNFTIAETEAIMSIVGTPNNKVENIEFENLEFNNFGSGISKEGYYPYQAGAKINAQINVNFAENLKFKNIKLKNISNTGFWIREGCSDIQIRDSDFQNLGGGAIKIGIPDLSQDNEVTNNITVFNNMISKGGQIYPDASAVIIFDSFSNKISNNDISDFSYTAISVGWTWGYGRSKATNNLISFNKIHNIGKGLLDDLGGIYTLGISTGTIINNNVIYDVKARNYGGWGIYTDEGSSNIVIQNNLVYNCSDSGYHHHYGRNVYIENNIFAYNILSEIEATKLENHQSLTFRNNLIVHENENFFGKNWQNIIKQEYNNIYYSNNIDKFYKNLNNKISKSQYINPHLEKIDFYYILKNREIYQDGKLKEIDFSNVGIHR